MNVKLSKFLLGCLVAVACALPGFADDAGVVKMVTYFPVPYAAYNNLYIKNKFDVGTQNDGFVMELGGNSASDVALSANEVFLRQVNTLNSFSTLKIDNDVSTQTAVFGNTAASNNNVAAVHGHEMTVNTALGSSGNPISRVTAEEINTGSLDLFGKGELPACGGVGATWQRLTIGSQTGYYLVCCKEADDCVDCYYPNATIYAQNCANSVSGADWCSNKDCKGKCGCSCSEAAHSHAIDNNRLCGCDDGYTIDDNPTDGGNFCVPNCSVYSYRWENKQECCPAADPEDTACYTGLKWGIVSEQTGNLNGQTSCSGETFSKDECATKPAVEGAQCEIIENKGYTCNPGGSTTNGCCYKRTVKQYKHWPSGWQP